MMYQHALIPSTGGHQVPVDVFIPAVCAQVDPDVHRPAVVICPGGGYSHLSEREAEPVALRFVALGFNTFVVKYRVLPNRFPAPQQDVAAVMGYIRAHADELHTDPNRIALMGFSAGGHLAGSLGVMWQRAEPWAEMGLKPEDVKPNALVLSYAVLGWNEFGESGTLKNLTGSGDPEVHRQYSVTANVTESCPPTFLWHTFTDTVVPVANSLMMAKALAEHHVQAELHVYPEGPHGAGLCNEYCAGVVNPQFMLPDCGQWPEMAAKFLKRVM